jgi:hypothetical protein
MHVFGGRNNRHRSTPSIKIGARRRARTSLHWADTRPKAVTLGDQCRSTERRRATGATTDSADDSASNRCMKCATPHSFAVRLLVRAAREAEAWRPSGHAALSAAVARRGTVGLNTSAATPTAPDHLAGNRNNKQRNDDGHTVPFALLVLDLGSRRRRGFVRQPRRSVSSSSSWRWLTASVRSRRLLAAM